MDKIWIALIAVGAVLILTALYKLFGIDKIRSWLLWAVTQAEREFGSGTGKLKLAFVYDLFIAKFPKLQIIVPFKLFSALVDQALAVMKEMLKNDKILAFVEKEAD
ncbi:MAG: hypothetical protein IKS39_03745 [Clostridia bacterium]|nr:hypothetical protein [Clostridia bacterium]